MFWCYLVKCHLEFQQQKYLEIPSGSWYTTSSTGFPHMGVAGVNYQMLRSFLHDSLALPFYA